MLLRLKVSRPWPNWLFCVGQPGQVLVQAEFETWSESLLTGMTVGEKASLRRLILEATDYARRLAEGYGGALGRSFA